MSESAAGGKRVNGRYSEGPFARSPGGHQAREAPYDAALANFEPDSPVSTSMFAYPADPAWTDTSTANAVSCMESLAISSTTATTTRIVRAPQQLCVDGDYSNGYANPLPMRTVGNPQFVPVPETTTGPPRIWSGVQEGDGATTGSDTAAAKRKNTVQTIASDPLQYYSYAHTHGHAQQQQSYMTTVETTYKGVHSQVGSEIGVGAPAHSTDPEPPTPVIYRPPVFFQQPPSVQPPLEPIPGSIRPLPPPPTPPRRVQPSVPPQTPTYHTESSANSGPPPPKESEPTIHPGCSLSSPPPPKASDDSVSQPPPPKESDLVGQNEPVASQPPPPKDAQTTLNRISVPPLPPRNNNHNHIMPPTAPPSVPPEAPAQTPPTAKLDQPIRVPHIPPTAPALPVTPNAPASVVVSEAAPYAVPVPPKDPTVIITPHRPSRPTMPGPPSHPSRPYQPGATPQMSGFVSHTGQIPPAAVLQAATPHLPPYSVAPANGPGLVIHYKCSECGGRLESEKSVCHRLHTAASYLNNHYINALAGPGPEFKPAGVAMPYQSHVVQSPTTMAAPLGVMTSPPVKPQSYPSAFQNHSSYTQPHGFLPAQPQPHPHQPHAYTTGHPVPGSQPVRPTLIYPHTQGKPDPGHGQGYGQHPAKPHIPISPPVQHQPHLQPRPQYIVVPSSATIYASPGATILTTSGAAATPENNYGTNDVYLKRPLTGGLMRMLGDAKNILTGPAAPTTTTYTILPQPAPRPVYYGGNGGYSPGYGHFHGQAPPPPMGYGAQPPQAIAARGGNPGMGGASTSAVDAKIAAAAAATPNTQAPHYILPPT